MSVRKQLYELSLQDLERSPVWEFALEEEGDEGQDEATVRPYDLRGALDPADGMFVIRASFELADGTPMHGYVTPPVQEDNGLGTVQPIIVTDRGQIAFWCGVIEPSREHIDSRYALLGKTASEVFPIRYQSRVPLIGETVAGSIPGFLHLKDWKSGKFKVIL